MSATRLAPLVLEGRHVRLEPLELRHCDALWEIAREPDLWRWTANFVDSHESLRAYVEAALAEAAAGRALPFVTIARDEQRVVGSTRFGSFEPSHRRVEIGWTFIGARWQRSAINTDAKLTLLGHAFDVLGLERVEFKTDALNQRSRRAIARLGATEEGTFRRHMLAYGDRWRDTLYFSVLRSEWPSVRTRLEAALQAGGAAPAKPARP